MPSIRTTTRGGVIRWDRDDWFAGQSAFAQSGSGTGVLAPSSVLEGKGFAFSIGIDPYRVPGVLTPGFSETALTHSDTLSAATQAFCQNGKDVYFLTGSDAKVWHLDAGSGSFDASAYATLTHSGHTTPNATNCDAVYYKAKVSNTNTPLRFYTLNDDTDAVLLKDNAGTIGTIGTLSNKGVPHPMRVGTDDILYIGDGNTIATYEGQNGTDGTLTLNKFVLPTEFIINSLQNLPNYLVIFANKSSDSTYPSDPTVFLWDKRSADPTYKYPVDCFFITASFVFGTTVGCFGSGKAGVKQGGVGIRRMFLYDGSKFDIHKEFPSSIAGDIPQNGVVVLDNTIYFTTTSGTLGGGSSSTNSIFSFGKNFVGNWSLDCIANTLNSSASFLGSFKNKAFYTEGSTGHQPILFNTDYFLNAKFVTTTISPPLPPEHRARILKLKVGWGQVSSSGRAFEIYLNTNKGQNTITVAQGIGSSPYTITNANLTTNYLRDVNGKTLAANFFESINLEGRYTTGGGATGIPPLLEFVECFYTTCKI